MHVNAKLDVRAEGLLTFSEEEPNRDVKIWNWNGCLKKQTDEFKPVLNWCDVHEWCVLLCVYFSLLPTSGPIWMMLENPLPPCVYHLLTCVFNQSLPFYLPGCECQPAGGRGPSLGGRVFCGRSRRSEDACRPSSQHTQQHGCAEGRHHPGVSRAGRSGTAWVPPD